MGCKNKLFESASKFDSGCGWPSFDQSIAASVTYIKDTTLGMQRTEIVCSNCGGHLGHVFDDGPTKTGQRYCVNSLSVDFEK
jgi:peptide-methionine (R)-S-oxide reductase